MRGRDGACAVCGEHFGLDDDLVSRHTMSGYSILIHDECNEDLVDCPRCGEPYDMSRNVVLEVEEVPCGLMIITLKQTVKPDTVFIHESCAEQGDVLVRELGVS